MIFKIRKEQ